MVPLAVGAGILLPDSQSQVFSGLLTALNTTNKQSGAIMQILVLRVCAVALCMSSIVSGCAMQSGREFDTAYVDQIARGKTTKAEVRSHLGEPISVTTNADGEVWSYAHQQGQNWMGGVASAYTGKYKMTGEGLTIVFSGDVVKDFTYTKSQ